MERSVSDSDVPSTPESILLERVGERAQSSIAMGALAGVVGGMLLTGLSSSDVGVLLGGGAVIAGPCLLVWRDRGEARGKQALLIFGALMAFLLVAQPLVHGMPMEQIGKMLGWVGLVFCPAGLYGGWIMLRDLPAARESLSAATFDARLEIVLRRGYGGIPHTTARLWPADSADATPARFSWQVSAPRYIALEKARASVHGEPRKGAVVVVSCPEAVLVGRISRSYVKNA